MVHRLYDAADMCYIASVNGWDGYPYNKAVDTEQQIGNDMTASNYEGTAPTGQTSAQGIPIPGSTLVVGAMPFFRLPMSTDGWQKRERPDPAGKGEGSNEKWASIAEIPER